ncbi:MAG: 5-(carboxyamino)imidazole ribonucleotide mutase [bacterium]|nr:5-(carboxyamino)imidazole ribonucleotide mutase [bacterium]
MKTIFILGSDSDKEFTQKMLDGLSDWGIETEMIVASAHKVPKKVADIVEANNVESDIVYVGVAGRSNALSGVLAANSVHPVFACPPFKDKEDFMVNINSSLMMPSETPVMTVVDPGNLVLSVVKIFALKDDNLRAKVNDRIRDIKKSFEN